MPSVTLFSWNLRTAVANNKEVEIPLNYVMVPDVPITVKMDFPNDEFNSINKDPLLIQIMADTCKELFLQTIRTKINPRLKALDQQSTSLDIEKFAAARKQMIEQVKNDLSTSSTLAKTAIEQRIQKLETEKKQYIGYRKKVIKGTVQTIVGAVAAGAGLAGAVGTGGATLVISVIAGYRTLMGGMKLIADCWAEAATVQKRIESALKSLKSTYDSGKGNGIAREVGVSALNAIAKVPIPTTALSNLSTISSDNDLWKGKLTHLRFLAHEMSETLSDLLDNVQQLKAKLANDPKHKKYVSQIGDLEKKVNKLLTEGHRFMSMKKAFRIDEAHQEAEKGLEAQKAVEQMIKDMKAARSGWVDHWDKIINVVADLSIMAAGYGLTTAPSAAADFLALSTGVPGDTYGTFVALTELGEEFGVDVVAETKKKVQEVGKKLTSGGGGKQTAPTTPTPAPVQKAKAVGFTLGGHRAKP